MIAHVSARAFLTSPSRSITSAVSPLMGLCNGFLDQFFWKNKSLSDSLQDNHSPNNRWKKPIFLFLNFIMKQNGLLDTCTFLATYSSWFYNTTKTLFQSNFFETIAKWATVESFSAYFSVCNEHRILDDSFFLYMNKMKLNWLSSFSLISFEYHFILQMSPSSLLFVYGHLSKI